MKENEPKKKIFVEINHSFIYIQIECVHFPLRQSNTTTTLHWWHSSEFAMCSIGAWYVSNRFRFENYHYVLFNRIQFNWYTFPTLLTFIFVITFHPMYVRHKIGYDNGVPPNSMNLLFGLIITIGFLGFVGVTKYFYYLLGNFNGRNICNYCLAELKPPLLAKKQKQKIEKKKKWTGEWKINQLKHFKHNVQNTHWPYLLQLIRQ